MNTKKILNSIFYPKKEYLYITKRKKKKQLLLDDNLKSLDLRYIEIDNVNTLYNYLSQNKTLTKLQADQNVNILNLKKVFEKNKTLNKLKIIVYCTDSLINFVSTNNTITYLNLDMCTLGSVIKSFFSALEKNNTLKILKLKRNSISNVFDIFESLQKNNTLEYLDLSWNFIGKYGIDELCESLQKKNSLTGLDLRSNDLIKLDYAEKIYDVLRKNNSLVKCKLFLTIEEYKKCTYYTNYEYVLSKTNHFECFRRSLDDNRRSSNIFLVNDKLDMLLQKNTKYIKEKISIMLCARKYSSNCLFHENNFPLDLFKIIYLLIFNFEN